MEFDDDDYVYLEKAVENPNTTNDKEKDRSASRHRHRSRDDRGDRDRSRDRDRRERERRHDKESKRESEGTRSRERAKDREPEREFEGTRSRERAKDREPRESEREIEGTRSRERAKDREPRDPDTESRKFKDKKEQMELEVDPERDQRTVFAYQMPLKATERDVYEFFSQVGKVRDVRLIMDRNSRRSKGVGYVEFYDAMSVPQAIALSGQLLLGQPVMVKPSEAEKNLVQPTANAAMGAEKKLYVGNLHFNITVEQLHEIFDPFGLVETVQLPMDIETGHCRGYGFVQFAQAEYAKAALSLNGKLEVAGRVIKVSAVTDHAGWHNAGTTVTDFDDEDGGGLSLNARSRAILMQKLDRTGTASSIAASLGVSALNSAAPLPINGETAMHVVHPVLRAPSLEPIVEPSECLLLQNMFDPKIEVNPDFDEEIKEDVLEECSKFGLVEHIYVDKNSNGSVYLRFENVAAASNCQGAMHGRWFAGRAIIATYMRRTDYEAKFGQGT